VVLDIEEIRRAQVLVADLVVRVEAACVDRQLDRRIPFEVERAVVAAEVTVFCGQLAHQTPAGYSKLTAREHVTRPEVEVMA
jgi:hypothetical protein